VWAFIARVEAWDATEKAAFAALHGGVAEKRT
jgi:hypothetical protein